jgi:sigma-B regulation protein RsbU (phosphoserine phosphatase)
MVTAKDNKQDIVEAMDAGADDYVTKPYDKAELLARIRAGFRVVFLEQELSEKNRELLQANTIMKNDLLAASRLQKSFLPKTAPKIPGFEFSWLFYPCEMVGGDTFNVFFIDEQYVAAYVLDVSGHGVPAAMLSVMLSRILTPDVERGGILTVQAENPGTQKARHPREVAQILNRRFPMDDDVGQYFTMLYVLIHLPTLTVKFIQAGHPHLLLVYGNGKPEFLRKKSFSIGWFEDTVFEESSIQISAGDRLFLYSDGIIEASNLDQELYGSNRLARVVSGCRDMHISETIQTVSKDVKDFIKGAEVSDDMTLLGISVQ